MPRELRVEALVSRLRACKKDRNLAAVRAVQRQIACEGEGEGGDGDGDGDGGGDGGGWGAVGNHLVPALIECGRLLEARHTFDRLPSPNACSWTYLIQGYVHAGHFQHALSFFWHMRILLRLRPNRFTFLAVLKACTRLNCLVSGRQVHSEAVHHALDDDEFVGNSLVDMYAKCGSLREAHRVLDCLSTRDVISWTALIAGYAEHELPKDALRCLERMEEEAGSVEANAITYVYALKACAALKAIARGREIHAAMVKDGLERDELPGSTLMDLYAKCGLTEEAHDVFLEIPVQNAVLWTTLIAGYAEQGLGDDALACFDQMQLSGATPDGVTFICSLKACGSLGLVDKGQSLHAEIMKEEHEKNSLVGSTVLDMYAKCGLLLEMSDIFEELSLRDVVTWTSLMSGYASHGESELVFHHFELMCNDGVKPNETTFLVLFTTCNHGGLVRKGAVLYDSMIREHQMAPTIKHLNCMLDLLGRAGRLDEALWMLQQMPTQPNIVTWETILGSCRKWGNVLLARHAFESAVTLDEEHHGVLVLMSNIYANEEYDH